MRDPFIRMTTRTRENRARRGPRVIGKIKGLSDGPMTRWSDGPISHCLQNLYRLKNYSYSPEATPRVYYVSKVLILRWHSHGPGGHAAYTSSLMQREQQNRIFEQWLVAYEMRLIQV